MKRRFTSYLLAAALLITSVLPGAGAFGRTLSQIDAASIKTTVLEKSVSGNPMLGFDDEGKILYGGDPSILVDGDTVYCYVGHDASTTDSYRMPDWRVYSSKDMKNWTYHGIALQETTSNIRWAANNTEAWAGQVMKHKSLTTGETKYYFYYTTEANSSYGGGKSVGVAVADSPTGPFVDIGKPLVANRDTPNGPNTWEDIDPTAWIETDENGVEHRYLGWGNTRFFVCELNDDMISITDRDGNPNSLSVGYASAGTYDIVLGRLNGMSKVYLGKDYEGAEISGSAQYTEAPYYYRMQDENGNYYGPYYMFFAYSWRECMAYATTNDIMSNEWTFGGIIMDPSTGANTNHMAVFDFKGQSYFVYHDGSLPIGSGYRRVACCEKFDFNPDGSIDPIKKTATGLTGTASVIKDYEDRTLTHEAFRNTCNDGDYPIHGKRVFAGTARYFESGEWEIKKALTDTVTGANTPEYVSIESNDKPGLHLAVEPSGNNKTVVLSQYYDGSKAALCQTGRISSPDLQALQQTFKTYAGLNGDQAGVSFESVAYPGFFLTSSSTGAITVSEDPDVNRATFYIDDGEGQEISTLTALKTKRVYAVGESINVNDIRLHLRKKDGSFENIERYATNASSIDMSTPGDKTLTVTYEYRGEKNTANIKLKVVDRQYSDALKKVNQASTSIGTSAFSSEQLNDPDLLAYFDFNTAASGGVITGTNAKATVNGSGATITTNNAHDGSCLSLTGGSSFLSVTKEDGTPLLAGNSGNITISYWSRSSNTGSQNGWAYYAAQSATAPDQNNEHYFAVMDRQTTLTVERFNTSATVGRQTANEITGLTGNVWRHVVISADSTSTKVYVDGELRSTVASNVNLSTLLGSSSVFQIGKANWGSSGEFYSGLIDDFAVYNRALNASEALSLFDDSLTPESLLEDEGISVATSLDIREGNRASVDLQVHAAVVDAGAEISYQSNKPEVATVDTSGVVTGVAEGVALVTTTVKLGSITKTGETRINVLGTISGVTSHNLLARYTFDNTLKDSVNTSRSASPLVTGLGAYNGEIPYVMGKIGGAVDLGGQFGFQLNTKNIGNNYTVSMWINPSSTFMGNMCAGFFLGYHSPEKWLSMAGNADNSSEVKFWGRSTSASISHTTYATPNIRANQWTHVVITGQSGSATLYLNGSRAGTASAAINPLSGSNQDVYVGVNYWDPAFPGVVDDVQIFDGPISTDEITYLYDQGNNYVPSEADSFAVLGFYTDDEIDLLNGESIAVRPTLPDDVTPAYVSYSYAMDDDTIASVSKSGTVTGKKTGDTFITITGSYDDGNGNTSTYTKNVPVRVVDIAEITSIGESFDTTYATAEGKARLQAAIAAARAATTYAEAEAAKMAIIKAINNMSYIEDAINPFSAFASFDDDDVVFSHAEVRVDDEMGFMQVPNSVENYVDVVYVTGDRSVATVDTDGVITFKSKGTVAVKAVVESLFDGYKMEYVRIFNVLDIDEPAPTATPEPQNDPTPTPEATDEPGNPDATPGPEDPDATPTAAPENPDDQATPTPAPTGDNPAANATPTPTGNNGQNPNGGVQPGTATKKANTIVVKAKKKTVKAAKLAKKAQKVKALKVTGAQGTLKFKLVKKGSTAKLFKKAKISKKGVIKIKKVKLKKKTYKLKVSVTAAGNTEYDAKTVTVTVKVKIK